MKIILPILSIFIFCTFSAAQQPNFTQYAFNDTTSHTIIGTALRQQGVVQKVEYINNVNIGGIYLGTVVARNLKNGEVTKGAYFSNDHPTETYIDYLYPERRAYIDEVELDELIGFFRNCDSLWKKERPAVSTSYEIETKDKFRIRFISIEGGESWRFILQFRNYFFFYVDSLSKSKTDDLYNALLLMKKALASY